MEINPYLLLWNSSWQHFDWSIDLFKYPAQYYTSVCVRARVCMCARVCVVPGGGISRSVVCWTLVLPGRGSKAGTRAENCLFRTKSSSHVLLRPPLVSYSSSSCRTTAAAHPSHPLTSLPVTLYSRSFTNKQTGVLPGPPRTPGPPDCRLRSRHRRRRAPGGPPHRPAQPIACWRDSCPGSLQDVERGNIMMIFV